MFQNIYNQLYSKYGPQGWWPIISLNKKGVNPTKTGSIKGYHPEDYSYPKDNSQKFEIILGTILTQNTFWVNVEKALINLKEKNYLYPKKILEMNPERLKELLRPAGYFNQKTKRAKIIAKWFLELKSIPSRKELLSIHGIGQETADSILLYAFNQPSFVIDTYTRRILTNLKIIQGTEKYSEIKKLIESNLKKDFKLFQEYHALLVEHAKHFYLKKENYKKDFLLDSIKK
jgi:endonuclease-3 related protein